LIKSIKNTKTTSKKQEHAAFIIYTSKPEIEMLFLFYGSFEPPVEKAPGGQQILTNCKYKKLFKKYVTSFLICLNI
jgi:hypothetical protein